MSVMWLSQLIHDLAHKWPDHTVQLVQLITATLI